MASFSGVRPDSEIRTRSQVSPTLICAWVGGHAAFVSDAENAAGTVKVSVRLPSAPVLASANAPRSMSLISSPDGLTIPARPLASTITIVELAGRLPAAHEIAIVDPGVTSSTAAELDGVVALL